MKKTILLFIILLLPLFLRSQDSVNIRIDIVESANTTLSFIEDSMYTDLTNLPSDLFNRALEGDYDYIGEGWTLVSVYQFTLPKEFRNYLVFKAEFANQGQTIIGCIGMRNDISIKIKAFENKTGVINSIEMYQQAMEMQRNGNKRKANKLLEQAAECGNVLAMRQLWKNYENGIGCMKSEEKARYWFEKALIFGY